MAMLKDELGDATSQPQFQRVLDALRGSADVGVPAIVLASWQSWSPDFRSRAIDVLLSRNAWTLEMMGELKAGRIAAADFDPTRQVQLTKHRDDRIKQLAAEVFASAANRPSRSKLVQQYQSVLQMRGDAVRGQAVFKRVCIACHQHDQQGHQVGPDLKSVADHSPEKLLANILDPNLDIQPGYQSYGCLLDSGELLFGLIAAENATGVVFKLTDGRTRTVLRHEIESLKSTGVSLMPENLESTMTKQEIADVIAFLRKK
jgi:putative heme-binding domain-containing protein